MGSAGQNGFHDVALANGPGITLGRSGASYGQAHFCPVDFWPHNTALYVTDFKGNDPLFVFYFLRGTDFSAHNTGGAQQSLNRNFIYPLPVAYPSLEEQREIALVLSDMDTLITGLDQLISKKHDIQQAAMQQLLTGQRRLPGFSGEWGRLALGEMEQRQMVRLFRGNVISKKDIEAIPGDFPIYSSSVKENGLFGRYGHYMFDEELITWSVDGGGNFFYRPKHKFSVTNVCGYMRVLSPTVHCRFLAFQLQELHSKLSFDYTTKAHPSVIRGAYTLALPDHTEQIAIAQTLSDMQNELASLEAQRDKVRLIKHGMMQELLTGRIRLSEAS
jgi:type I restriction enzyme S subunit